MTAANVICICSNESNIAWFEMFWVSQTLPVLKKIYYWDNFAASVLHVRMIEKQSYHYHNKKSLVLKVAYSRCILAQSRIRQTGNIP